ncbi:MAG: DEAD/DEAH box helicase family protein [archaeon]|nr:DEAD/DEAH box helicase family protein [archaeon]MCR4323554.1 DEAD/DEAH box helicase family protein [Nanoarchaeota archaeon]
MWSLFEKKESDYGIGAGLFDYTGKKLEPLVFSNGKTQTDIVKEVLDSINDGNKVIFIHGVCGTGKSAIALNLARHFKKTSIVVPIKSLQDQYENDYTKKKFLLKKDGNPLKIAVIKGRGNFPCNFGGDRANDPEIPCIIEIKERNNDLLLKYIEKNPATDREDFSSASDVRRMNVAPACPYWAPIMPSNIEPRGLGDFTRKKYMAVCGKEYALFQRKKGCPYYDQYEAYVDADVLIFNSMKYNLEMLMGRKPKSDLDIIDECDEFMDNFANERRINLSRLHSSISNLVLIDRDKLLKAKEILKLINDLLFNPEELDVMKIDGSPVYNLVMKILESQDLAEEEEVSYYNNVVEIVRTFENLLEETYISMEKVKKDSEQKGIFEKNFSSEDNVFVNLVSINLAQKFRELVDANNVLVLMSGTLHSEEVLRDVFGLENFKIIEAETKNPGETRKCRTGLERNCSFANFKNGTVTRERYLKMLDVCMANAEPPTLVHISAFKDLPTEEENKKYKFDNLITKERLHELQRFGNSSVDEFTSGETKVLFTTKCSRGVDFPGEKCNSVVITRFPYPNIQGLFWRILKKEQPEKFMEFYMDKARRDLVQKVARGVRFKGDKVDLWSPDVRVLNNDFG